MKSNIVLLFLFLISLFYSCNTAEKKNNIEAEKSAKDTSKQILSNSPKIDTLLDDYACIISGILPKKYYLNIVKEKYWNDYKDNITKEWDNVKNKKINPIFNWSDTVANIKSDSLTIFYPFAGADFLYAHCFFRNANNYILIGLEPVGSPQCLDSMKSNEMKTYLTKIDNSLYFSNSIGFFRTRSMEKELTQNDLNGTYHLLMFYLKRCGFNITAANYFTIDTLGNLINVDKKIATGLKIDFCDSTLTNMKSTYYLSWDLSNSNINNNKQILSFVSSFNNQITYLKAASYLLHKDYFSTLRDYILSKSKIVLQDDSGIPYKMFIANKWDISLFGKYNQVISLFENKYQDDLKKAFESVKVKLPFNIGYNAYITGTNLLLAKKK